MPEKVAILDASENAQRYAFKAFQMLKRFGHITFPLNPHLNSIENSNLATALEKAGVQVVEDCTLMMLQGDRF